MPDRFPFDAYLGARVLATTRPSRLAREYEPEAAHASRIAQRRLAR